jgi:Protein of unknown function (DUF4058)
MPLRDHFRPPVTDHHSWDELYGGWPMKIVESLNSRLPPGYMSAPQIDLGDKAGPDEYEVRVYQVTRGRRLAAAVELVSPSNKDRPETRQAFIAKCAALLQQQVSVTIVDLVTIRESNLYADLLTFLKQTDPSAGVRPSNAYAVTCRGTRPRKRWVLEGWYRPLVVGQPLPKLPLWLTDDLAVDLDLESSYEQTCRVLQIA